MELSPSLVAVRKITSSSPRSNFADEDLERAANSILEAQGIINPIVLRRTSIESYEVVNGHFEYYAAARAREINLRKGEMIGAFIIESENEATIQKQIELFRKFKSDLISQKDLEVDNPEKHSVNLESRLNNIEARFEKRISDLQTENKREIDNLEKRLKEIESRLPKPIKPLEAFNTLSLPNLISCLKRINIKQKIIENIVSERDKNGQFKSLGDAVNRVQGLGEKTMIKIIDYLSESMS